MKRSKEEAEVIVRLDFLEQKAYICVSQWPAMAAKMTKKYGISRDPGSKFSERWIVPLKTISFRSLATKKPSTRPFPVSGPRRNRAASQVTSPKRPNTVETPIRGAE